MAIDNKEIMNKVARRVGLPTTQVSRVLDAYADEYIKAGRQAQEKGK
jgi:predicted DsbA family dithiol-disulfide isomerase